MNPSCIFLMGPTASGKTDLALSLVKSFPCDIISVDSAMVYRGMDIGTAKPSAEILAQVPHRLINIRDPVQTYSSGQFHKDAIFEIQTIQSAGRIPLLVGGTMLYFHNLQQGLSQLPPANSQIRQHLNSMATKIGWTKMHQRLAEIDPQTAQRIHPNDSQRIQRALEIYEISGYTMSAWYANAEMLSLPHPIIKIVLAPSERSTLHAKITHRFHAMLEQGLIEEVRGFFQREDLSPDLPAMRCVGYRQVWRYLAGELDYANLLEKAVVATRQLAKRQLTWLRAQTDAHWFDNQAFSVTEKVHKFLEKKL